MSNKVNYQQVCQDLLKDLNSKQKEIISRRFGLKKENKETLALIGDRFNITRERVRQIEKDSIDKQIKPRLKKYSEVFKGFRKYLESFGGIKKEDILLEELGDKENQAEVYFLLSISENFKRYMQSVYKYKLTLQIKQAKSLFLFPIFLNKSFIITFKVYKSAIFIELYDSICKCINELSIVRDTDHSTFVVM